jgi:hypothetical protein
MFVGLQPSQPPGKAAEIRAAIVTYGLEMNRAARRSGILASVAGAHPAGAELGARPSGKGFDSPQ